MASLISGFEYDIFISYRQKDNKGDKWVSVFVESLKTELESTFKEEISVFFDINPHDGLMETDDIDKSLGNKLKSLIFIPILSQTYCDPKSYAWKHELLEFNRMIKTDPIGSFVRLRNGNVSGRILPAKIHDLDPEDKELLEQELGGVLRSIEFIYKEPGVNRPLKPTDNRIDNFNKTDYRNQVNKTANTIKEIANSLLPLHSKKISSKNQIINEGGLKSLNSRHKTLFLIFIIIILASAVLLARIYYFPEKVKIKKSEMNITANTKAYEWFMKSVFRLDPMNKDELDSCIFFLNNAISYDSSFALAYARLSMAYSYKNYFFDPNGGYSEKAFMESEKALYYNPDLAEGYFARAYSTWSLENKFPHEKVIREYKKAIKLNPSMDLAYQYLGVVYSHVGLMDESIAQFKKAIKINPDNMVAVLDIAGAYTFSGKKKDLEMALDIFKNSPQRMFSNPLRSSLWATSLIRLERYDEAENILSTYLKKDSSDLSINCAFAMLMARNGDKEGALKKIEFCEKGILNTGHLHHAVYNLAVVYAIIGEYDKSVGKLRWVAENGFPNYVYFRDDPLLASLHHFPPYEELLKNLKISYDKFRKLAKE